MSLKSVIFRLFSRKIEQPLIDYSKIKISDRVSKKEYEIINQNHINEITSDMMGFSDILV
jgi:hypothetical protein